MGYTQKTDPETTSRALGVEISASPKHCREVCKMLVGKKVEDAKKYLKGVIELIPARARRTYIRGLNTEQEAFVRRLRGADGPVRTHRREIPIIPEFVGKTVHVYNGKEFAPVDIKPEMIGHALGEFALTRRSVKHSGLGVGATRSSKFMPLK